MLEFTEWAKDILQRADTGARRLNPAARIRLVRRAAGMEATLVDASEPGDSEIVVGESSIFVEQGLEGLVDIQEPHDQIVLRPLGSAPNLREAH